MSNQKKRCHGARGGFTLVELLVIVVILGVILVAALPGIQRYLPRYRLNAVADNVAQAARVARHGAVTKHANHVLRFWSDRDRTILASAVDDIVAFDILVDRNNNMVEDLPPGGTDAIIKYPLSYKDVVVRLDPTDGGNVRKEPYDSLPWSGDPKNPIVFRPDGRPYEYDAGTWNQLDLVALLVLSKTLGSRPTPQLSDPLAEFRWRWVEIDQTGGIRIKSKGEQAQ